MEKFNENIKNDIIENPIITIKSLTKDYDTLRALNDVNLTLSSGRIIGLLGPNGSGKTTLIKILTGLINNYNGEVLIDGNKPGVETKSIVAYLPDINILNQNWTSFDAIKFYSDYFADFNAEKAKELIAKLRINPKQKFKQLSKGTKDKVQLILTLSREAKIYIFDEPIAGVDPAARELIFQLILNNYNKDATIIISTHLIHDAETILDDVIFLLNGEVKLYAEKSKLIEHYEMNIDELFRKVYKC